MSEFQKMVDFLDAAWCMKDQIVPCLIGEIGIGKTAAVEQHAKNVGAGKVVEIIASQVLPNEISGITMPDPETKSMQIYDHYRLSSLEDGDILFFDELLEADQMVLSACLTLIESRKMMSGRKLPDIQIVAATNPTIAPTVLKPSIRNRFVFRKFEVDKFGCCEFIKQDCGMDVSKLLDKLYDSFGNYNILSQRSLTKMARWIAAAKDEELDNVASIIDNIWENQLGTQLANIRRSESPKEQMRKAILSEITSDEIIMNDDLDILLDPDKFHSTAMSELMSILEANIEDWNSVVEKLSNTQVTESKETVSF